MSVVTTNEKPLLAVNDVHFAYPGFSDVLHGVTFNVAPGELVTLLGPNGAGKSTLLNCIAGLAKPRRGSIHLDGYTLDELGQREVARRVAYVRQQVNVGFAYTVREYVAMGRAPHLALHERPGQADYALVDAALDRLGIQDLADRVYSQLSGGQRQLVDVARALAQSPQLILFDEPTSALDYGNQMKVLRMVRDLSREGFAIIMTTHNPDHPILLGGSVCLLDREGYLSKGTITDIMREDVLERVYGVPLMIREVSDAHRQVCMTAAFD